MNDNLRGALWLVLSAFLATVMSVGIRDVSAEVHSLQITFVRCLVAFILIAPLILARRMREAKLAGENLKLRFSRLWRIHIIRGILATAATNCGFYALTKIPFATVTVLFFTAPIFVTLMASLFLREEVGWRRWTATAIGFLGTVLTANPAAGSLDPVLIFPVAASFFFAVYLILGKKLSVSESPSSILLFTSFITTICSILPALFVWTTPSGEQLFLLLVISLFATGRTYCDVRAYAVGEASFIAPFSYTRLIFMVLAGYFFFLEVPSLAALAGGAVIIASSLYIAHREALKRRQPTPVAAGTPGE